MDFDKVLAHLDRPEMQHMRGFVRDVASSLQNLQNDADRRVRELVHQEVFASWGLTADAAEAKVRQYVREGLQDMSELVNKLVASAEALVASVADHDAVVKSALEEIKGLVAKPNLMDPADAAAITDIIAKVDASSKTVSADSDALRAAAAPAAAPTPPAAPAA